MEKHSSVSGRVNGLYNDGEIVDDGFEVDQETGERVALWRLTTLSEKKSQLAKLGQEKHRKLLGRIQVLALKLNLSHDYSSTTQILNVSTPSKVFNIHWYDRKSANECLKVLKGLK